MDAINQFKLFTRVLGLTPFHPQFFSKSFLNNCVRANEVGLKGVIVDLGCGQAVYKKYFRHAFYIGLDHPLTLATTDCDNIDLFGDLTCLPLRSGSVDGVLCTQVLEHVRNPKQAIVEMGRIVKGGGKVLLSFPFFYPLHDEPYDFFRYSPHGMEMLLIEAGFSIINTTPQGGYFTMAGEFFNLFLIHKIKKLLDEHNYLKYLGYVTIPFFLICAFLINVLCWGAGFFDKERRFVMNYFIVAGKKYN